MKIDYIRQNDGCRRLLLIFSGWSTSPSFYKNVVKEGWDTVVVTGYDNLYLDTSFLNNYDTVWLFAWSLGVRMASLSLPEDKITAAFAINGTLNPINDLEGIPYDIFTGTLNNLNARNLAKFQLRMSGGKDVYNEHFAKEYSSEEIDILKRELEAILNADAPNHPLCWHKVFLSEEDKIFPFENMMRGWFTSNADIVTLKTPHYVDIRKLVDTVVPDIDAIARRFSSSNDSYENNALAQRKITIKLGELLGSYSKNKGGRILEIGAGKGLFTKIYAEKIKPDSVDFVDLTKLDTFGIAPEEHYYVQDAEQFLEEVEDNVYDVVLSSSAVQWFSNFPRFLKNASRVLKPGGLLCFSTFAKGNLEELDNFRISPLHYFRPDEISSSLYKYFRDIKMEDEFIKLKFASSRELLMHLKLTGVGGFAPSAGVSPLKLRNTRSLTFHPVYVLARKS